MGEQRRPAVVSRSSDLLTRRAGLPAVFGRTSMGTTIPATPRHSYKTDSTGG